MRRQTHTSRIGRNAGPALGARTLLNAHIDFAYEGKYYIAQYNRYRTDDTYSRALTHRYVDGVLRFMWVGYNGSYLYNNGIPFSIREGTKPANFGGDIPVVASYNNVWTGSDGTGCWMGLYWDEQTSKVWSYIGIDYPDDTYIQYEPSMQSRTLPAASGLCTGHSGWHGLRTQSARCTNGRHQRVPTWAQTEYGFKPWISFGGGYHSRMIAGKPTSLGPVFIAYDDPSGFTPTAYTSDTASIPLANQQILTDTRGSAGHGDWYVTPGYAGRLADRGCKVTNCVNDYNHFEGYQGWASKPNLQPPGDPDGWNRWTWGDSFGSSGNWIDNNAGTRTKHGIVCIQRVGKGRMWYQNSQLNQDEDAYEIMVYDPADLNAVKNGTLGAWKVRPKSIAHIPNANIANNGEGLSSGTITQCVSASYDAVAEKLWVGVLQQNGMSLVLQYAVAT